MKRIMVEHGEVKELARLMGCTCAMVSYSLAYRKNSRLARAIRKLAIERGGIERETKPKTEGSHEAGRVDAAV